MQLTLRTSFLIAISHCLLTFVATGIAQEPNTQTLWDLERLSQPPEAEWLETDGLVQEVKYRGEPFEGKPTRVFAYVGRPDADVHGKGPFPGMVLAHGGGGQAFSEWARHWAKRGYVAISMDTAGCGPGKVRLEDGGPDQSGETKFRDFTEDDARDMWTYHAVSDVVLAHSLLRSLPEVDPQRTALTGISWGGYLTCLTAGVDSRFKAAVPVYGCGFLGDNSAWSAKQIAGMPEESRRLWLKLFDPGQHVGRVNYPVLFLNGTNDFAYPLDSYRKTIEQVRPELATAAIHLRLPHGHIWTFGIVDAFVDSHLREGKPLTRLGEARVAAGLAYAPVLEAGARISEVTLLYTHDEGAWQTRKWETLNGSFDAKQRQRVQATLPDKRPITFILQATDDRGLKTSTTHYELPAGVDESNPSLVPAPKLERDFYNWHQRHADILRIKGETNPQVVLIGDSITHMWGGRPFEQKFHRGQDSWDATFGKRSLNLGFGWDRTQNVLWRIDHGELDGLDPHTVVIHIGTNNLAGTPRHPVSTPAEVAAAIRGICQRVQSRLPEAKVVLMAVFPRGEKPDFPQRSQIAQINNLLQPVAKELGVTLLDITPQLLEDDGTISKQTMGDFLHPTATGYAIWANALKAHLAR